MTDRKKSRSDSVRESIARRVARGYVRLNVYLPPKVAQLLEKQAEIEGATRTEIVCAAILLYYDSAEIVRQRGGNPPSPTKPTTFG